MWVGLLTDTINNNLEISNLINELRLTVNLLTENLLKNEPYNLRNVSSFAAIFKKFSSTMHCNLSADTTWEPILKITWLPLALQEAQQYSSI